MNFLFEQDHWALILGASSGFGLATAKKLSQHGMNLCLVHRDRKGAMEKIEQEFAAMRKSARGFLSFNLDALSANGRAQVIQQLQSTLSASGKIRVLFHSIAFGNLKPIAPSAEKPVLEEEDMAQTIYSMGTSLLIWTQELFQKGLFAQDARILAMTSEGRSVAWKGYAAISAAKGVLESVIRSIAVEFASHGIRANAVQAGVTNTPALRLIPNSEKIKQTALLRNPFQRLTQPEDVANVISLLCLDEASWVNGTVIRVDGGEQIAPLCIS